jgi:hypothetical protein
METLIFFAIVIAIVVIHVLKRKYQAEQWKGASRPRRPRTYTATREDVARFFESVAQKGRRPERPAPQAPGVDVVELTEANVVAPQRRAPGRRPGFAPMAERADDMDVEVIRGEDVVDEAVETIGVSAEELKPKGPALTTAGYHGIRTAEEAIRRAPVTAAAQRRERARREREAERQRLQRSREESARQKERARIMRMLTGEEARQERLRKAMAKLFDTTGDYRRGIIMMEVLGTPKGLREEPF